jgi:hypothetical protein
MKKPFMGFGKNSRFHEKLFSGFGKNSRFYEKLFSGFGKNSRFHENRHVCLNSFISNIKMRKTGRC